MSFASQDAPPVRASSKTYRAASVLKSGVVYGGTALLSGVNAITPHFSGAVDIMVVEQPDGTYRSTPFYVRFGKYTHLRSKDRQVQILINGQLAPFYMHLGEYGQAYFTSDSPEAAAGEVDDEEQATLLAGMMSPPSGYSSGDDERPQFADPQVLASVQEEVQRLRMQEGDSEQPGEGASSQLFSGSLGGDSSVGVSPPSGMFRPSLWEPLLNHTQDSDPNSSQSLSRPPQALGASPSASVNAQGGSALGSSPPAGALRVSRRVSGSSTRGGSPLGMSPSKSVSGLEALLTDTHPSAVSHSQHSSTTRHAVQVLGFPDNSTSGAVRHTSLTVSAVPALQSDHLLASVSDAQQPATRSAASAPATRIHHSPPATSMLSVSLRSNQNVEQSLDLADSATNNNPQNGSSADLGSALQSNANLDANPPPSNADSSLSHPLSAFQTISAELVQTVSPTLPNTVQLASPQSLPAPLGASGVSSPGPAAQLQLPPVELDGQPQGETGIAPPVGLPPPNLLGPISPYLQGLELSLCGEQLQTGVSYSEAVQIFEECRVGPAEWAEKGHEMIQSLHLMVRLQGEIYPWASAAPLVLGWAAFGAWWPHLVPTEARRWVPPTGLTPHNSGPSASALTAAQADDGKKGWRLWPFSTRKPLLETTPGASLSSPALLTGNAQQLSRSSLPKARHEVALSRQTTGALHVQRAASTRSGSSEARRLARLSTPLARKTLSPSHQQLNGLKLRAGQNTIKYVVGGAELVAFIYFYHWTTKLVISDVDGTITRSDVLGHLLPAMGWDWSHAGISRLFTDIAHNCYQLMYLSSRSISQAGITRDYLNTLVQGQHRMPVGPVIISPHGLLPSLYREMILRRPHEFKIATLQDIRALFPAEWNPFYAGFGNRDTDELSYRAVGVPLGRIFIINPKGELRKAAMTMQSSTLSSLAAVNQLIDDIFPPCARSLPTTAVPADSLPPVANGTPEHSAAGTANAVATAAAEVAVAAVSGIAGSVAAVAGGDAGADTDSVAGPTPHHMSQQALLTALRGTAEDFNDNHYWNSDPSMYMAGGDVDELERFVVAGSTPPRAPVMGKGRQAAGAMTAVDEEDGGLREEASGIEMSEGACEQGRSFIASYNPFAY